jgi:glycosyltransferase involved in cell wall biosynthesis
MTDHQINNNKKPLVSIVITSYNRAHFIEKAIETALAQDYPNLEIIISDNCSTDNTDNIVKKYLSDPRTSYFKNELNMGMTLNFKIATEQRAHGKYITYISSDDYLVNNHFISQAIDIINKYEKVYLVFGRVQRLLENNILVDNTIHIYKDEFQFGKDVFLKFPKIKALGWGAALINRDELNILNVFISKATSIDYEANLTLMLKGNVGFIKEASYVGRVHDNQISKSKDVNIIDNVNYVITPFKYAEEHKILHPDTLLKLRNELLFQEIRYISLRLLVLDKKKYNEFMQYSKLNYRSAYNKVKMSVKWNIMKFFYRNPSLSINFIKLFSRHRHHYKFLKSLKENKSL